MRGESRSFIKLILDKLHFVPLLEQTNFSEVLNFGKVEYKFCLFFNFKLQILYQMIIFLHF